MDLGVYIHFPWCRARCPYCDFAVAVAPLGEIPHVAWADAVIDELGVRAARFAGRRLRSIYFGGGTPALWQAGEIAGVVRAVRETFGGGEPDDLEITVEANPLDCRAEILAPLGEAGVNRLSIGTQSFNDSELVFLGRDHGGRAAKDALAAARSAGFSRVSLDLIYALVGRTLDDWRRTLDEAIELAPEHLSVYQLTIEPRTPFGQAARAGKLTPVEDDLSADEFELAHATLEAAGWEHYEVSSYARAGKRAVHNSLYWSGGEYLGLGNGAHSFWKDGEVGLRWSNHRSVTRYLAGAPAIDIAACPRVAETIPLDQQELADDLVWTGMRVRDGVPRVLVEGRAGLARLFAGGLVEEHGDRIRPTARGLLFADEIAASLIA